MFWLLQFINKIPEGQNSGICLEV